MQVADANMEGVVHLEQLKQRLSAPTTTTAYTNMSRRTSHQEV